MDTLNCALIQSDTRWADRRENRAYLTGLLDRAGDANLYVLPETCTTGFLGDLEGRGGSGDDGRDDVDWLLEQARRRGAAIAAGLAVVVEGERRNRLVFAMPDGIWVHYDKRHLFGHGGEDQRYTPGRKRVRLTWRGWRFDLQICYDLRFPVWCRNDDPFDVQLFVANWPTPRADAWRSLLCARAIENQAYVIGVNRAGRDGKGLDYPGSSRAFGPSGEPLLELGDSESVAHCTLDRSALRDFRERLPFLEDRDAYAID